MTEDIAGPSNHGSMPTFSDEQFNEMHNRLERMSGEELAQFRAAPEHAAVLRQFEEFAHRQMRPFLFALILLLIVSVTVGSLLAR